MDKKPITNKELQALLAKEGPIQLFWDQNNSLSSDDIEKLVDGGVKELDRLEEELINNNQEGLDEIRDQMCDNVLKTLGDQPFAALDIDATDDDKKEHLLELLSDTPTSANIRALAKNSGRGYFTVRFGGDNPSMHQACSGIRHADDLRPFLDLLKISPHHYQDLVPEGSDLVLPEIPEYEGNSLVDINEFRKVLHETMYGGELVFLCGMPVKEVIEDLNDYHTGDIKIHKGTLVTFHDYLNGATACHEAPLLQDLLLPHGSAVLCYDYADRRGVQTCCGMTDTPWKKGNATPIPKVNENEQR